MRHLPGLFVCLLTALPLVACTRSASKYTGLPEVFPYEDALRERASFDLSCPPKELRVVDLGGGGRNPFGVGKTAGVEGCGQKATYVRSQQGAWIANTVPDK